MLSASVTAYASATFPNPSGIRSATHASVTAVTSVATANIAARFFPTSTLPKDTGAR